MIMAGCANDFDVQQKSMPIRMTTSVARTRAIANPTQESQLVSGEKVYVWANQEAVSGTPDWTTGAYLKAWTLTADGSGALNGSSQYYSEGTLSMVAIHGNFTFTEGTEAYPGTVEHSVAADQNTAGGYEQSDLMWWSQTGVASSASAIPITFARNLSKIEITLVTGDYTADELDKATVKLQNVLPTVSMDMADGSISDAYGSPITITPRKTGKINYEAILPPQQKPLDFIRVELGGTVIKVDAKVEEFDANTRYPYDLNIAHKDVRKNPLWYVAEYNVNYDGSSTYSWATTPDEGYYFNWTDAYTAALQFDGWHLPTEHEWNSIVPGRDDTHNGVDLWTIAASGNGTNYSKTTYLSFGYNDETYGTNGYMKEKSYWYHHSSTVVYAIRYCDTEYCSAWKYEIVLNGQDAANPSMLVISSTLLGESLSTSEAATLFGTDVTKWESVYYGNDDVRGAVQRFFCNRGAASGSGTTPSDRPGIVGFFWSSTTNPSNSSFKFHLGSSSTACAIAGSGEGTGASVRLFHTNRDPYWGIKVGDIILSDGSWATSSNIDAKLAADNTLRPVAIVFATTTGANAISMPEYDIYKHKNGKGNFFHGYAMALRKCNGALTSWCNNVGSLRTQLITRSTPATLTTLADVKSDYKGYEYCNYAKNYCTTNGIAVSNLLTIMEADNYKNVVAAPVNTSGWYLPSIGQMYLELRAFYSSVVTGSESWSKDAEYPTYSITGTNVAVTAINNYIRGKLGTNVYNTYYQPYNATSGNDNKIKLSAAYTKEGSFTGVVRSVFAF